MEVVKVRNEGKQKKSMKDTEADIAVRALRLLLMSGNSLLKM